LPDSIHGDLGVRAFSDPNAMEWSASPSGTVWRKRVHLVGPPESGQVTSVVRYQPDSAFPSHDHPDGEEILVLDGVFSDEHGDWPAGTYLLNPAGFRHAPFSREGCLLFVKLRQLAGDRRRHVALPTNELAWEPEGRAGVSVKPLYAGGTDSPEYPDATRLERLEPGTPAAPVEAPGGIEVFVLSGTLEEEGDGSTVVAHPAGTWLRVPAGIPFAPSSREGCELYVKTGALSSLRHDPGD